MGASLLALAKSIYYFIQVKDMKFLILLSILCIFSEDLIEVQLLTETYNPLRIICFCY